MTRYLNQSTVAFGLSFIGLACGAWLIVKAFAEIGGALTLPNPKGALQ